MKGHRSSIWGVSLLSLVSAVACGGPGNGSPGAAASNEPPAGCMRTLCDFLRASCSDGPDLCQACLAACSNATILLDCDKSCMSSCSHPTSSRCDSALA